ncbi:MAG: dTMP kinase, partial [Deltaproteobacteria bacterium]|nr:dTMP kinase [Deltaproteobacteria bacterium]
IRSVLRGEEGAPSAASLPWLFAADRADHLACTIEPGVARGAIVISDRYYHSSLAYQTGAAGVDEIWSLNRTFRAPDLTVLVEVPVEVALRRIAARGGAREIFEHAAKLAQVADGYRAVTERLRAAGQRIATVDGDRPPGVVGDEIASLV